MTRLSNIRHLQPAPDGGYRADALVQITYQDGRTSTTNLNSDVEGLIPEFLTAGGVVTAYAPPTEPPATSKNLTKRQIVASLIIGAAQTDPDGFVETAIATLTDPTQRALALNDWRNAPYYTRSHPLFSAPEMLAATGLTSGDIDNLWALGVALPA